jgi:hypothetical protein
MLSENLTLVDNAGSLTNVGSTGSREYRLVYQPGADGSTLRRFAATANTLRSELRIAHQQVGKGFNQRTRTVVQKILTKVDQDTSLTGGVIPRSTVGLTIDRPTNMGGIVTDAILKSEVGYIIALAIVTANLDSLFNLEA